MTLAGNLLFVQYLVVPTFGNNTALWSLACEFWLYALYPAFLAMRRGLGFGGSLAVVLAVSAAAIALEVAVPRAEWGPVPVLAYWACWVLGAAAAEVYLGKVALPKVLVTPWFAACAVVGWLTMVSLRWVPREIGDTIGAAACGLVLLACLRHFREPPPRGASRAVFRWLSGVGSYSYSLYLVHIPVLSLICALWFLDHDAMPRQPWLWAAGVLISLAAGKAAFWAVERRFLRS